MKQKLLCRLDKLIPFPVIHVFGIPTTSQTYHNGICYAETGLLKHYVISDKCDKRSSEIKYTKYRLTILISRLNVTAVLLQGSSCLSLIFYTAVFEVLVSL